MRRTGLLAVGTAMVAALIATITPANATITGSVGFQCTAALNPFPAVSGTGTCNGTATVSASGTTTTGTAYTVAGANVPFAANFTYFESCPAAVPAPPPTGSANGHATVTGLTAVVGGATTTARLDTDFDWTRGGNNAVILTKNTTITFGNGQVAKATANPVNGRDDYGTATFVPNPGFGTCTAPAPTTATVSGTDTIPA